MHELTKKAMSQLGGAMAVPALPAPTAKHGPSGRASPGSGPIILRAALDAGPVSTSALRNHLTANGMSPKGVSGVLDRGRKHGISRLALTDRPPTDRPPSALHGVSYGAIARRHHPPCVLTTGERSSNTLYVSLSSHAPMGLCLRTSRRSSTPATDQYSTASCKMPRTAATTRRV